MTTEVRADPGSFRDPSGGVIHANGSVFRYFRGSDAAEFARLTESDFFRSSVDSHLLIATTPVERAKSPELYAFAKGAELVVEHPKLPFVSYPYEWPFEMLKAAAECQMEVIRSAFDNGYLVKDATPYNVQFLGCEPTFVDVASIEPYKKGATWAGYTQFCQTFLNPLLLQSITGVPFQPWLRSNLDGIEPDHLRALLPWRSKFRKAVFLDVVLQSWLGRKFADDTKSMKAISKREAPKEVVSALLKRMEKQVSGLKRRKVKTTWSDYEDTKDHYSATADSYKEAFVRSMLTKYSARTVWDLGANRGQFSLIASEMADQVVAIDFDEAAVGALFERLRGKVKNVLPLVIDFLNPSPAQGWGGVERQSLTARSQADSFLCLALIHHLSISGNVPFSLIASWLASIAPSGIVEFVPKDDPMVKRLLLTKKDVYPNYTQEHFEACLKEHFAINERASIPESKRVLYWLGPR
ncbi:MAG TPA: methyltransferase [Dehalococcoidia bacterium]|jgi:ribosomal protein L11 methylase PrmA|nr:methyltransferase [Dehalococcoidia bacterium]